MKNNIKVNRAIKKISQDELAKLVGVSRQTINAIENNKYYPSLELGLKLSKILECSVNDLFSLDDESV
jgi:putative transcriptional regulator